MEARQPRSAARRQALLAATRRLLRRRDFEQIAVAEIAQAAGSAVGSVYNRFADKPALLAALAEALVATGEAAAARSLAAERWRSASDRAVALGLAGFVVDGMLGEAGGVLRAVLAEARRRPALWLPLRLYGARVADRAVALLAPRVPAGRHADPARAVRIAMQMLYGTAINALLHDPGPLRLGDASLPEALADLLIGYLGLESAAA